MKGSPEMDRRNRLTAIAIGIVIAMVVAGAGIGLGLRARRKNPSNGVVTAATTLTASQTSPPEVILYGDSLAVQGEPYFNWFTAIDGQANVVDNVFPGTAPCNWLPQMLADASAGQMSVAVIEFSGNALGCMDYPVGSDAYYDAYEQQVQQAASAFSAAGVHTFLIGAPMNYGEVEQADTSWDHLNEIYAAIAASVPDTTFVNAGASVEANQQFAWTLPCLSFETYCGPGGQNIVRAQDGGHFCPQDPNAGASCAAWNSGAIRYGITMAGAVTNFLSSGSAPAYEGSPLPPSGTVPVVAAGQVYPYANVHDALTVVQPLTTGQSLQSLDVRYTAVLQGDGNFVVYGPDGPVWSTNTAGTDANRLVVQTDGNVVLYGPSGPLWSTGTAGTGGDYLAMQEDGNLVLYGPTGSLWSTLAVGPVTNEPVVAMARTPDGAGYWLVDATGQVDTFGDAANFGSMAGQPLNAPMVGMAATPDGGGYWLLGRDGGVFTFGDAGFYGSTGSLSLNQPVLGIASTPDGGGYWLVAADGGVFAYGDASFYGSMGGHPLDRPVVGMAATSDGHGYYLVASDGGIFCFGDAAFEGSMGGRPLNEPVVGMATDPATGGYWEVAADGGIFAFNAPFLGSTGSVVLNEPIVGMTSTPTGQGYRFVASDGGVFDYGDAQFYGSAA